MSKADKAQITIGVFVLLIAIVALALQVHVYLKARKVQKEFERVTGGDYEALRQIIAQAIINTIPTG